MTLSIVILVPRALTKKNKMKRNQRLCKALMIRILKYSLLVRENSSVVIFMRLCAGGGPARGFIGLFQIKDVVEVQYNDLFSLEKRPNTGFPKYFLRKPVLPSFKFLEKACIDFLKRF